MPLLIQIAGQLREVYFGGNWTSVNYQEQLKDVTWHQAIQKVHSFNTIATLVYHTGYYILAVEKVLMGGLLDAKDQYSFDHPSITSEADWQGMLQQTYDAAKRLAALIEQLPESKLYDTFVEEKYGNYYRNLTGIIEHLHYHLGQIVLIKKLIAGGQSS